MAYMDFTNSVKGQKERKAFYLSPDGIQLLAQWRREGVTIEEIAVKYVGCSTRTFHNWIRESDELAKALNYSADLTNSMVESALLKRALGYDYEEDYFELVEGEMRRVRTITKHVSPDTKACLSWLFSRRPDRWHATQPDPSMQKEMETVKKVLVAMKEVAESGEEVVTEIEDETSI